MTPATLRLAVPATDDGARLDVFLTARIADCSRSALRRFILDGRVSVEGKPAQKPGQALKSGMRVEVELPDPVPSALLPESIAITIVHEDDALAVIDKPAGLVVHPGHGRRDGTLVNALLGRGMALAPLGGASRPGIVHRLDMDTSGLLVVAKTDEAHRALSLAFAQRRVRKVYRALVWGRLLPANGVIERGIGRSRANPTRMAVDTPGARAAHTTYETIESLPGFTLLRVAIATGRTHQIRVHLTALHHAVVGDTRYGGAAWKGMRDPHKRNAVRAFRRLALHASRLAFVHPVSGEQVSFHSPLPEELEALLRTLRGPR